MISRTDLGSDNSAQCRFSIGKISKQKFIYHYKPNNKRHDRYKAKVAYARKHKLDPNESDSNHSQSSDGEEKD